MIPRLPAGVDDPEDLPAPELMRYAEQLIRDDHKALDPDWAFWVSVADHLNVMSHTPEKTSNRHSDWSAFNRATSMAIGYILLWKAAHPERSLSSARP
jgi:hypothetical protein